MNTLNRTYMLRVLSVDGEIITEDRDFLESAAWDFFDELVRWGKSGETVQLIRLNDDGIEAEKFIEG